VDSGSPPQDREEKLRKLRHEACELLEKALNEIWFIGMGMRPKSCSVLDRDQAFFETSYPMTLLGKLLPPCVRNL